MKKVLSFSLVAFATLFLVGCGSNVDLVKDGTLKLDESISIGQALDNWKECKSSSWEEFETDNGKKVVEFSCDVANLEPLLTDIKKLEQTSKDLMKCKNPNECWANVVGIKKVIQFVINKDGETFNTDYIGSEIVWSDGRKYESSLEIVPTLEDAYSNKGIFDDIYKIKNDANMKELYKQGVGQLSYIYFQTYNQAKK